MNAQLPVTNNALTPMLKRSSMAALWVVAATFCYSVSCTLMRRYVTPDLSASFLHAVIVGLASWLALPLYGLSAMAWRRDRLRAWSHVLAWAVAAFVLATTLEHWLTARLQSFEPEQWLALLHRRVPMALALWGFMWWWSRQHADEVTLNWPPKEATTPSHHESTRWSLFQVLTVSRGSTTLTVPVNDVRVFRACENYVELQLNSGETVLWRGTMKSLRAQLPSTFIAIHRSYIVRRDAILRVTATKLVLSDQSCLPIGRQYLNNLDAFRSGTCHNSTVRSVRESKFCQ